MNSTNPSTAGGLLADPERRRGLLLLALLTLIWGVNWPVMKTALAELPPWTFRSLTVPAAGLILMAVIRLRGGSLAVPAGRWGPLALAALFNVTGWHLGTAYGVARLASGQAAVIAFTMPVWASLLGVAVLGERLTGRIVLALAFGMTAIGVLMWDAVFTLVDAPAGLAFMLGAAVSWASGTVLLKRVDWQIAPVAMAAWQLVLGAIPIVPIALLTEVSGLHPVSWAAATAVIYIVLGPLSIGYLLWNTIIRLFPVNVSAIGTLMIPVLGVISGAVVLGEPIGLREVAALALVCSALALVLFRR
jgi:drug/metabolite transporter (DMT)-like permease